jgi:predicted amidohydrolase YtcJ
MRSVAFTAVVLSLLARSAPAQWNPHADVIFAGGSVVTVDESFTIDQALAIKDGRIIAVGSDESVLAHRGEDTRVIDLDSRTVIPGLQDSHIHFVPLGNDVTNEVELTYAMSADEIVDALRRVKERRNLAPGEWLTGRRWDQYKYPVMVTRWQLDEVAPNNPVLLSRVYRGVAVNTKVFELMGIDDQRPETWPEWWLNDPEDLTFEDEIYREARTIAIEGRSETHEVPTGVFLGSIASGLVTAEPPEPTLGEQVESVRLGVREMLRLGVTSVVDPASRMGEVMRVYQEALNRGYLDLRLSSVYEGIFFRETPEEMREHFDAIKINNLGNSLLRWRGVKFYADGGVGTRSAWVSEPFAMWEELEGEKNFGLPVVADSALREAQYRAALDWGWELHTHNTGDQAMRQTVDLYMKLLDEIRAADPDRDADPRWSIIHAYFPIEPKTRVLEDMARYGIVAATNPVFNWQQGYAFATNSGRERMERLQPFRSYTDGGVVMASGSDYGVTTHNPWMGFYALLTRKDQKTGLVFGPAETIGIEDALRSYTWNGAYLTHEEDSRGSLEVGKLADLVVLDLPEIYALERNPELCFEMDERIDLTMVEGRIVFQAAR